MFKIKSLSIPKDYHNSKQKIYTGNEKYYKISNIVEKFNREKFADWMQDGFANSKFKKQIDLVKAAKSNPATISRLMNGSPQTTNNKASQPPKELVIRLAELFEKDVNEALILAGHAPLNQNSDSNLKITGVGDISLEHGIRLSEKGKEQFEIAVRTGLAIAEREEE